MMNRPDKSSDQGECHPAPSLIMQEVLNQLQMNVTRFVNPLILVRFLYMPFGAV